MTNGLNMVVEPNIDISQELNTNEHVGYDVTFSTKGYESKPTKDEFRCMHFQKENLSIEQIVSKFNTGYAYLPNLKNKYGVFTNSGKKDFQDTHIVHFDFDDTDLSLNQIYTNAEYTPTYLYTSYSNSENQNRFHVIYLFEDKILSQTDYEFIWNTISKSFEYKFGGQYSTDTHAKNIGQICCGSNYSLPYYQDYFSNITYNTSTFGLTPANTDNILQSNLPITILDENAGYDDVDEIKKIRYWEKLSIHDFLRMYFNTYSHKTQSDLIYNKDGYAFTEEQNYIEVYREWETYQPIDSCLMKHRIKKTPIGKRHSRLYQLAILFRQIYHDSISLGELVFNLACEVNAYFDGKDGDRISMKDIIWVAKKALKCEISIKSNARSRFKVSKEYCLQQNLNYKGYIQTVRKKILDNKISNEYNYTISLMQNLRNINEKGIKCSERKLRTWFKEHPLLSRNQNIIN